MSKENHHTINDMLKENQDWIEFYEDKLKTLRDRRAIIENMNKLYKLNRNKIKK